MTWKITRSAAATLAVAALTLAALPAATADDDNGLWGRVTPDSSYGSEDTVGLWERVAGESISSYSTQGGLWGRLMGESDDRDHGQGLWGDVMGGAKKHRGDMDSGMHEGMDSGMHKSMGKKMAHVRVIHASPDAPAVDVWIDDMKVITNLSYGEGTTYAMAQPGKHNVTVVPTGETGPAVIDANVELLRGESYTVLAAGTLAEIQAFVLADDARTRSRDAQVRFVHVSPDAPAVDVGLAGGGTLFGNVSFGESTGYQSVRAGSYELEARLADTDTVALDIPAVELAPRTAYTAYAIGRAGDETLQVLWTQDSSGRGR